MLHSRYPNYLFISDNEFSRSAGLGTRYSDASLRGIVLDIHFLSLTDYLVCTFSSQVRVVRVWVTALADYQICTFSCKVRALWLWTNGGWV